MYLKLTLNSIQGCSHQLSVFLLVQFKDYSYSTQTFNVSEGKFQLKKELNWNKDNIEDQLMLTFTMYRYSKYFVNSIICSEKLNIASFDSNQLHHMLLPIGSNFILDLNFAYEKSDCDLYSNTVLSTNEMYYNDLPVIASLMSPFMGTFFTLSKIFFCRPSAMKINSSEEQISLQSLSSNSSNHCYGRPRLELTLAIIKPDVFANPHSLNEIRKTILNNDFLFVKSRILRLDRYNAEKFYQEHQGKFFYERLVGFMSSGPLCAHILAKHNAIKHWRTLMGPTKVYRAQYEKPECLRAQFGLTDTRNATHGSDSTKSAEAEIKFFFPNFNLYAWYQNEEKLFRNASNIRFVADEYEHQIGPKKISKQWFF